MAVCATMLRKGLTTFHIFFHYFFQNYTHLVKTKGSLTLCNVSYLRQFLFSFSSFLKKGKNKKKRPFHNVSILRDMFILVLLLHPFFFFFFFFFLFFIIAASANENGVQSTDPSCLSTSGYLGDC